MRRRGVLILLWMLVISLPKTAFACSVCFGDPESMSSKSVILGVILMLGVTAVMLGGIAFLIWTYYRRARAYERSLSLN